MFITGMTDTGKSTLARELLLSAKAPRLIIDPKQSTLFDLPGIVAFSDPRHPPEDAATARFIPTDPGDLDAYDVLYRWAWSHFPRYILADEAGVIAPARGAKRWVRTLVIQGRARQLGHVSCHTRPRELDANVLGQSAHVIVFGLPLEDDRKYLAGAMGLPPKVLNEHLDQLDPHAFIWWDQRRKQLTVCPPLDVRR